MPKPIAIVTGASSGIGKNLAIKLSDDYFVYLISRNNDRLQKVYNIILSKGNECEVVVADISKKESLNENIRFGLRVPHIDNLLSPILLTLPLQMLAYHVALLKNCDVDKPRNLAKSVTVE